MMRKMFVPSSYERDIHDKIKEIEETTIVRFLHGLNREIQDIVKLQSYSNLGTLVHQEIKVEKDKEKVRSNKSSKKGSGPFQVRKEMIVTPTPRTSGIKCFKCLGKRHIASQCPNNIAMTFRDDGKIKSDSSHGDTSTSSDLKSCSDDSHVEKDLLMVKRLMGSQMIEEVKTQRENIFHSRCHVLGNLCSIIIKVWLSEYGELVVDRQVEVYFTIGKFEDKMLCNVVPMEATHLLLGRP
ncbi:hypothetical protein CR513_20148, partial [Mucuna pruriens]